MQDSKGLSELDSILAPLDDEARRTVLLAVDENWRTPPMTRWTVPDDNDLDGAFIGRFPGITNAESGGLTYERIEQMMASGQVAYPMALKKAPVTSIVRSPSGFTVKCADEHMADLMQVSLARVLSKRIEEILTFLEYGAYYGESTFGIAWPQDYGLPKSETPYWILNDLNGCHPTTIDKINRNEKTRAFEGFTQKPIGVGDYNGVFVGLDRALLIPNRGSFGNLEGESELGPIYVWWFWYEMVWRSFLRFLQRTGSGVVIVKAPSRGRVQVQGKSVDNMSWALQMASGLQRTNYAAIPSDMNRDSNQPLWAIDTLRGNQNDGKQFIEALELLGGNIKNFLLTGRDTAVDGGEFEVMLDTERVLSHIGVYFSEYLLPKWLMWNGSKTRVATLDFQGANSRVLPLLFKLMAVAGNTAGDYLKNVDWRMLFSRGGVPILDKKEVEKIAAEEAAGEQGQKARMQPGGEGRWDRQRDKEGRPPKLSDDDLAAIAIRLKSRDMVSEALQTPVATLSASQVAGAESLGVRVDNSPIELFNPYHDKIGRFTTKAGATGISYSDQIDKIAGAMVDEFPGVERGKIVLHKTWPGFLVHSMGVIALGCYSPITKSSHVSPKGAKAIKAGKEIDFFFGKYKNVHPAHPVVHEILHSRRRKNGRTMPIPGNQWFSFIPLQIEEGTTELLSRKFMKDFYGHETGHTIYEDWTLAVADWAWLTSGGDVNAAWDLIDEMHMNSISYSDVSDLFGKYNQDWSAGWRPDARWMRKQLNAAGVKPGSGYENIIGFPPAGDSKLELSMSIDDLHAAAIETDDEIERWVLLETLLWAAGDESNAQQLKLFNPYHDKIGRFTTKTGAVSVSGALDPGFVKDANGTIAKASRDLGMKKPDVKFFDSQNDYATAACDELGSGLSCRMVTKRSLACSANGKVFVGPAVQKMYERDRASANYVLAHEAIHTRRRSSGSYGVDGRQYRGMIARSNLRAAEEGLTDLLARRYAGFTHKTKLGGRNPAYESEMHIMAAMAYSIAGGDVGKAWGIIEEMHYNLDNSSSLAKYCSKAFGQDEAWWSDWRINGTIDDYHVTYESGLILKEMFGG